VDALAALLEVGRRRHPVLLVFDGEDERAAYATSSPPATPPRQAPDQRQDEVMSTSSGHPVAPSSTASVHTDRAARYGKQLVSHLGRRATAEWDEQAGTGWIDFGETRAELTAGPEALDIRLSADPDALARMEDVVGRHLVRFGARDELTVQWVRADGTRGTRQENTGE
jgi:hypothetical protein